MHRVLLSMFSKRTNCHRRNKIKKNQQQVQQQQQHCENYKRKKKRKSLKKWDRKTRVKKCKINMFGFPKILSLSLSLSLYTTNTVYAYDIGTCIELFAHSKMTLLSSSSWLTSKPLSLSLSLSLSISLLDL